MMQSVEQSMQLIVDEMVLDTVTASITNAFGGTKTRRPVLPKSRQRHLLSELFGPVIVRSLDSARHMAFVHNSVLSPRLFLEHHIGRQPRVFVILDVDLSYEPFGSALVMAVRPLFGIDDNVVIVDIESFGGGEE